ncbi:hypothetical protein GCM10023166_03210 [Paeniglutamicibacter cryotolerans]
MVGHPYSVSSQVENHGSRPRRFVQVPAPEYVTTPTDNCPRNLIPAITAHALDLPARWIGPMIVQYAVGWREAFEARSGIAVALYTAAAFLPQAWSSFSEGCLPTG